MFVENSLIYKRIYFKNSFYTFLWRFNPQQVYRDEHMTVRIKLVGVLQIVVVLGDDHHWTGRLLLGGQRRKLQQKGNSIQQRNSIQQAHLRV